MTLAWISPSSETRNTCFCAIMALFLALLMQACASGGQRVGGGETLKRWQQAEADDVFVGLWQGQADCSGGILFSDDVLVGLQRLNRSRYRAVVVRIGRNARANMVRWYTEGQQDAEGVLTLLPPKPTRSALGSSAISLTLSVAPGSDEALMMTAVNTLQHRGSPTRCRAVSLGRVVNGEAGDFLSSGQLMSTKGLSERRMLVGKLDDLAGRWEGSVRCRSRIEPVTLRIDRAEDSSWRARYQVADRPPIQYRLEPGTQSLDASYGFKPVEEPRRRRYGNLYNVGGKGIIREAGKTTWLRISTDQSCQDATVYRFTPTSGLAGAYARADGFLAMCRVMANQWLGSLAQERETAKSIKIELSRSLANYDPERASQSIATDKDRLVEVFGIQPDRWSNSQYQEVSRQMVQCATLAEDGYRDTIRRALFAEGALRIVGGATSLHARWDPRAVVPLTLSQEQLRLSSRKPGAQLDLVRSASLAAQTAREIEQILGESIADLESFPPSDVKLALQPVIERVNRLRAASVQLSTNRFDGIDIPWPLIPDSERSTIEQLIRGEQLQMTSESQPFLAGIALHGVRDCRYTGSNTVESNGIVGFVIAGTTRATYGGDLSNPDIVTAVNDLYTSDSQFKAGAEFGQKIGCSSAFGKAVVSALGNAIARNRTDGTGGDSLFVRTCAVEHDRTRCQCLANTVQTVYPNVYQRPYSQGIVKGALQANPFTMGAAIDRCRIKNY